MGNLSIIVVLGGDGRHLGLYNSGGNVNGQDSGIADIQTFNLSGSGDTILLFHLAIGDVPSNGAFTLGLYLLVPHQDDVTVTGSGYVGNLSIIVVLGGDGRHLGLLGNDGVGILELTRGVGEELSMVTLLTNRTTALVGTRSNRGQSGDLTTMVVLIEHGVDKQHLLIFAAFPLGNTVGYPSSGILTIGILPVAILTQRTNHVGVGLSSAPQGHHNRSGTTASVHNGHVSVHTFLGKDNGHALGIGELSVPVRNASSEVSPNGNRNLVTLLDVLCSNNDISSVNVEIGLCKRRRSHQ